MLFRSRARAVEPAAERETPTGVTRRRFVTLRCGQRAARMRVDVRHDTAQVQHRQRLVVAAVVRVRHAVGVVEAGDGGAKQFERAVASVGADQHVRCGDVAAVRPLALRQRGVEQPGGKRLSAPNTQLPSKLRIANNS